MNLIKQHKEIAFLIGVVFVVGLASHDLFSDQQQNSGLINSGTTLSPSNFSGRITCEVPIPSIQSTKIPEKTDTLQEKLQAKYPKDTPAAQNN